MERQGSCNSEDCEEHFHDNGKSPLPDQDLPKSEQDGTASSRVPTHVDSRSENVELDRERTREYDPEDHGWRRIVRNFTPSWFMITMSTGVTSICLHQLPYNGDWLRIISTIFFVFNVVLFISFLAISVLRYTLYPQLIRAVLHHPHQSLFLATFPVGLATLINLIVLICVPVWGSGIAVFAWVLWWIIAVLALSTCFHLTFVIMSNQRGELAELTALYLIPIVAVVIVATSGGLLANVLPGIHNQLWTLLLSYIFWGIGSPLSWIILTLYFLRMAIDKPLQREVIVSLLLPIGPLGLSGFSLIVLGKGARRIFPLAHALPHNEHTFPGELFYNFGILAGLIFWGFAVVWFVVAIIMIALVKRFPFNMGWWGFIFPTGVFTLLTLTIGEELESKFFKILSCVLTGICVLLWVIVATRTVQGVISARMFYAPCLGTDLFSRRHKERRCPGFSHGNCNNQESTGRIPPQPISAKQGGRTL